MAQTAGWHQHQPGWQAFQRGWQNDYAWQAAACWRPPRWPMMQGPQREVVDEHGYTHVKVGGVVYPGFAVPSAIFNCRAKLDFRDGDIVIATYPKCGTTWMQQIVLTLLHGGDKSKVTEPMLQAPWIESMVSNKWHGQVLADLNGEPRTPEEIMAWDGATLRGEGPPGRRVFKTHSNVELLPWRGGTEAFSGKKKAIVVVRNPKDACVSLFHHTVDGGPAFCYTGGIDHFVKKLFLQGLVESGDFWEWHAGWEQAAAANPNIFWISFEEMKRDPVDTVRRLAAFLEVPAGDDVVRAVVGASAFDAMKARFEEINWERVASGKQYKGNHIRRGGVGTWREELQGELLAAFDAAHARKTEEVGLKYEWDFGEPPEEEAEEPAAKRTRREEQVM